MKSFLALGFGLVLAAVFAVPASAQRGGRTSALGGSLAPQGAMTHPLGGFTGGPGAVRGRRGVGRTGAYGLNGYPWGYSYYVPNYFDFLDSDDPYWNSYYGAQAAPPATPAYVPVPAPAAGSQQPIIINQYFAAPGQPPQTSAPAQASQSPAAGAAPSTAPQNYYLIAYKNHAVYPAIAYWVEDKTLHYVTTNNTHNQASLDLIDLELTKTLNQSNDVPFSIPGR